MCLCCQHDFPIGGLHTKHMDGEAWVVHHPTDDQQLSTRILEAIEDFMGEDLTKGGHPLYEQIDPDALDNLFRENASGNITFQFKIDDVTVELEGNGSILIRIRSSNPEE